MGHGREGSLALDIGRRSDATSTSTSTSNPSTTAGRPPADVRLRIGSISLEALTGKQQDAVERAVVHDLARSLSVPVDSIKDLDGNAGHLTLSQGSLIAQGSVDLPAGRTMVSVQDAMPSAAAHIARSISKIGGVQDAVVAGSVFAGKADEIEVCINDVDGCPEGGSGGGGTGVVLVVLAWALLAACAVGSLVAGGALLVPKLRAMRSAQPGKPAAASATAAGWFGQFRSRLSRGAASGEHAHPQTPERGVSADYAGSAHDEERQRLIPSGSARVPSSSAHSHASGRLPGPASPGTGAKSNSSRRLGKGWPPGYEPLQRETGAGA